MSLDRRIKRPRSESPDPPTTSLSHQRDRHPLPTRPPSTSLPVDMAPLSLLPAARPIAAAGPDFAAIFKSPTVRIAITSPNRVQISYHLHIDPLISASALLQKHLTARRPSTVWLAQSSSEFMDDVFPFFIEYVYKSSYQLPNDLSFSERTRALFKISVMGSLLGVQEMRVRALEELAETLRYWDVQDDPNDVARVCQIVYIVFQTAPITLLVGLDRDPTMHRSSSPPTPSLTRSPGRDRRIHGDIGLAIRGLGPPMPSREQEAERHAEEHEMMEQARWMEKQKIPQRMLVAKWTAGMKKMLWKHDEFRTCLSQAGGHFERYFVENLGDGPGLGKDELSADLYRKFL